MSLKTEKHVLIDCKTSFYFGDGTGRDTYVLKFNGGLFNQDLQKQLAPKGKNLYQPLTINQKIKRMTPPAMENKLTHYWSDGTGRDTYIKVNHGGRAINYSQKDLPDQYFHNNLRSYQKLPQLSQTPNNRSSPFLWKSEKEILKDKLLSQQQKFTTLKLCSPKQIRLPEKRSFTPKISQYFSKKQKQDEAEELEENNQNQ